jgi:hypothetical protein
VKRASALVKPPGKVERQFVEFPVCEPLPNGVEQVGMFVEAGLGGIAVRRPRLGFS